MKLRTASKDCIWICVCRDATEECDKLENFTELLVTKDFAWQYYNERIEQSDYIYGNAYDFFENYIPSDIKDFYKYAKEHNAIIDICNWNEALSEEVKNLIRRKASLLEDVGDSVGMGIDGGEVLLIQVVSYGKSKEYLIELNEIKDDGTYKPCLAHNASSEYGDIDKLIACIDTYLRKHSLMFSFELEPFDLNSVPDLGKLFAEGRLLTKEEISDIYKE